MTARSARAPTRLRRRDAGTSGPRSGPGEPFPPAWWRHVRARPAGADRRRSSPRSTPTSSTLQEVSILTVERRRSTTSRRRWPADRAARSATARPTRSRSSIPRTGARSGAAMWGNAILTRRPLDGRLRARAAPGGRRRPGRAGRQSTIRSPASATRERRAGAPRGTLRGRRAAVGPVERRDRGAHLTYIGREQRRAPGRGAGRRRRGCRIAGRRDRRPQRADRGDRGAALAAAAFDDAFAAAGIPPGDPRRRPAAPSRSTTF